MTRKGLAFGAGLSLLATGIATTPAQAAGLDTGFVSLVPGSGAEYSILAGSKFQLKAELAAGIVGTAGTVKFQVVDTAGTTDVLQNGTYTTVYSDNSGDTVDVTDAGVVTISGLANGHGFEVDDEISVSGVAVGVESTANGTLTVVADGTGTSIAGVNGATEQLTITVSIGDMAADDQIVLENVLAADGNLTYTVKAVDEGESELVAASLVNAVNGDPTALYSAVWNGDATLTLTAKASGVRTDVAVSEVDNANDDADTSATFNISAVTQGVNAIQEVTTITVGGTFAVGDRITISNVATNPVVYTVTAADVAGTDVENRVAIAASVLSAITATDLAGRLIENNGSATNVIKVRHLAAGDPTTITATDVGGAIDVNTSRATVTEVGANELKYEIEAPDFAMTQLTGQTAVITRLESLPVSGVYVFDTGLNTAGAKNLALASTKANVNQTVKVTAWLDSNDNGEIDSTEYQSPERTVNFLASSSITPTITWNPISVGDSTVVANVTFTPTLNGAQLVSALNEGTNAITTLNVGFERPGSDEVENAATVTYSNVTKRWTATSINMNAEAWEGTVDDDILIVNITSVGITDNVVTATTASAHNLQVGDRIDINATNDRADSPTSGSVQYSTVTSVPSATSFTYVELKSDGTAADGADIAVSTGITGTYSEVRDVSEFAVVGEYKAQVSLFRYDAVLADGLTKLGSKFTTVVGATVASSSTQAPTFTGVPSATVSATGKVKTGTNAANFVLSVYDKDGDPVGAGVQAVVTTTSVTSAGTVTIGGTRVVSGSSFVASTDANGQIAIALNNTSGAAGESVVMDANVQNVSATTFTATWEGAEYTIYDKADQRSSAFARNRAAAEGASVSMNLVVLDQWNAPIPSDTHRLLVTATQNGVVASTSTVAIAADGSASVTVADAGQDGDTSVSIVVQKLTAGVWASQTSADDAYVDWAGAGGGDLANVVIKYYDQTDKITLNADGASLPSGTAAELDANVTTTALKAVDTRFSSDVAETYKATEKATVGGKVTNANTGVAKSGAVVTLSATGVLFNAGGVWSLDSIDVLTNDGTFSVDAYSRVAGEIKVTVTHGEVSTSATVDFNAVGTVKGYSIVLEAPEYVGKGQTYRVQGQIKDVNGNGVPLLTAGTGTNPTLTVTYQGLGLVSGTLPTTTDASGNFIFYVLVGSNDEGTATITASYDIDGTSTTNAPVAVSKTVNVGQTAPVEQKVNAGSFKGYVAIYARGYEGSRLSAKVGADWVVVPAIVNNQEDGTLFRAVEFTGAGYTIAVRIYIDRVLVDTITVTTK